MLKASQWPMEALGVLPELRGTFGYIRGLRLDGFEMEMLETVLLCRPDLIGDPAQAALAHLMVERALEGFMVMIILLVSSETEKAIASVHWIVLWPQDVFFSEFFVHN